MAQRDFKDFVDTVSAHRAASGLKEQAKALERVADAKMIEAKAAKQIADAEAASHRAAAMAAQVSAQIEREKFNNEIDLKNAISEIVRIYKLISGASSEIRNSSGLAVKKIIDEDLQYKNNRSWLLSCLGNESDVSNSEKQMDFIISIDKQFESLNLNSYYLQLKNIYIQLEECKKLALIKNENEVYLEKCRSEISTVRQEISQNYKDWGGLVDGLPKEEDYLKMTANSPESKMVDAELEKKTTIEMWLGASGIFGSISFIALDFAYGFWFALAPLIYLFKRSNLEKNIENLVLKLNQKSNLFKSLNKLTVQELSIADFVDKSIPKISSANDLLNNMIKNTNESSGYDQIVIKQYFEAIGVTA